MTTTFNPKTDIAEIKRTISLLYQPGDVVELRALDFNGKPHAGYFNDFDKLTTAAARLSGTMMGVYLVLNPIKKELLARAVNRIADGPKNLTADVDIISRRWFPIDVDANRAPGISSTDEEHEFTITTAKDIKAYLITMRFLANSIIIADSGNGAHLLVRIDIPNDAESKTLIENCIEAIKAKFESDKVIIDKTVFNAARIWKCYGTVCKKGDFTEDRPHRTAKLIEAPNIVLSPTDALKVLAATTPQPETPQAPKTTYHSNGQEFDLDTWMSAHGIEVTKKEPYNGGTRYILKVCPFNSNHTGTSAAIFKMSNGAIVYKCQHDGCIDNDWRKLREMLEPEYADRKRQYEQRAQPGPGVSLENNGLPEIRVSYRNTKEITADAIDALNKSNNPPSMFKRGSLPVRVSKDECEAPYIEVMTEAAIRGRLDRVATYVKFVKIPNKRDENGNDQYKIVPAAVPLEVVRDVMSLPDFRLPALANITEIPTLRADGSILSTPGYDAASNLYYVPSRNLIVPKITENPTHEEMRDAVNLINEVYINFPYDSQASRANVIAATATPIYRPMIDGNVPLFITDKPQAGIGAGLATAALCMIATGREPAMFGAPKDEDEWAKVIFAAVKAGQQIIVFDNCDGTLYSSNLARLITAKTIGGRILGHSENATMPNNSMIFCNGNNITLGGDLQRRSYLSRMETDTDRAWESERNYLHSPLIPWVKENQGRIVAAYLTIAKSWVSAGKPVDSSLLRLGSFEEWQKVIGGILKHAGIEGFLGNRETVYQISDTESQQWESFTEALRSAFPVDFIVADVAKLVFPEVELTPKGSDINNALPDIVDRDQRKFSKSLGHALIKKKDVKWHNGLVIMNTNSKRHSAVVWEIAKWRKNDDKRELPDTNSPLPDSKGSLGELRTTPAYGKAEKQLSYIDNGKTNSLNSPLGTITGELAHLTPQRAPKRLPTLDNCPDCGSENIGAWPDGTACYYCMDCFPNFNQEVE